MGNFPQLYSLYFTIRGQVLWFNALKTEDHNAPNIQAPKPTVENQMRTSEQNNQRRSHLSWHLTSQTKSGAAQIAHVDTSLYTRGSGSEVCHVRSRGTARSFFREGHDDIVPTSVDLDIDAVW